MRRVILFGLIIILSLPLFGCNKKGATNEVPATSNNKAVQKAAVTEEKTEVVPKIAKIEPSKVMTGDEITIYGSGFGSKYEKKEDMPSFLTVEQSKERAKMRLGLIYFGPIIATDIKSWGDTKIGLRVPDEAFAGPIIVTLGGLDGLRSNPGDLDIVDADRLPSSDSGKIITDSYGNKILSDTIFVNFKEGVEWGRKEVIAASIGGEISGSIKDIGQYIKIPSTTAEEIESIILKLKSLSEVEGAGKEYVGSFD